MKTNLTEFVFGYGYEGNVDGVELQLSGALGIRVSYYFSGTGFDNIVRLYAANNRIDQLRRPGRDQYMLISARLFINRQFTNFYYDPDISMRVLFDVPEPAPTNATGLGLSNADSTVAVAAGASVAAVVVVSGVVIVVVVLVKKKQHARQSAQMKRKLESVHEQEKQTQHPQSDSNRSRTTTETRRTTDGWQKAAPRDSLISN